MNGERTPVTDLTIDGVRKHARRQLGLDDTEKTQFPRGGAYAVTLTEGQWGVIEKALDALVAKSVDAADLKSAT